MSLFLLYEKKINFLTIPYLQTSTSLDDSTLKSEEYDHTDHCVYKKVEYY